MISRFLMINADTSAYCMALDQSEWSISFISVLMIYILSKGKYQNKVLLHIMLRDISFTTACEYILV